MSDSSKGSSGQTPGLKKPVISNLKDRVSKLKSLRDLVDKEFEQDSKHQAKSVPKVTPVPVKAPLPQPKFTPKESALSSRAFPHQKMAKVGSEMAMASKGFCTCLALIAFLIFSVSIAEMTASMLHVEQGIQDGVIAHEGESEDDSLKSTAYVETQLENFQAGEAEGGGENSLAEDEDGQSADEAQLGPTQEGGQELPDLPAIPTAASSSNQAAEQQLPDMTGRNTCMNASRPWDPFLFGMRMTGPQAQSPGVQTQAVADDPMKSSGVLDDVEPGRAAQPLDVQGQVVDAQVSPQQLGTAASQALRHRRLLVAKSSGKKEELKKKEDSKKKLDSKKEKAVSALSSSSKSKKSSSSSSKKSKLEIPQLANKNFNKEVFGICTKAKEDAGKGASEAAEGILPPETQALRDCLRVSNTVGGSCQGLMDLESLRKAALQLPGVKKLMEPPKCITVSSGGECTQWSGNKETEYHSIRQGVELEPPSHLEKKDIKAKNWGSCALVGQAPQIRKSENAAVIDSHEAVWRFNLDTPTGAKKFVGRKTEVRVLNEAASHKAFDLQFQELDNSTWLPGEHQRWMQDVAQSEKKRLPQDWIMWNVRSNRYLNKLAETYKPYAQRVVAPEFIEWMLQVYFTIMADLEQIGLGPFPCEVNKLLSGTHAVFMSAIACEQTNVFGMSYIGALNANYKGMALSDEGGQHKWEFDGYLFRLLHIAGRISICTREDPSS